MQSWGSSLGEEATPTAFPRVGSAGTGPGTRKDAPLAFFPAASAASSRGTRKRGAVLLRVAAAPRECSGCGPGARALAGDPREGRDGRGLTGSRSPP